MTRMSRAVALGGLLVLAAFPAAAHAKGFKYGVTAGDVGTSSALIWTRSDKPTQLTLEVSTSKQFPAAGLISKNTKSKSSHDNAVTVKVTKLRSATRYFYRFRSSAGQSTVGQFQTAPKPGQAKTIKFAYSGDADAQRAKGQKKPFYNNFEVYGRMAGEGNDFNINLGDTIYSDTDVGVTIQNTQVHRSFPTALTLKQKWAKYRMNLALSNLQKVRRSAGMFNQWDDHEFVDDFTRPENGQTLYKAGRDAFLDYMPARYSSKDGIYRKFRWGKNAEFFFPDERSFRSAKARANHVCDNPQTHAPDPAPMLPQPNRDEFALVEPALSQPVSQACKNAINNVQRTFLGARQLTALENALMRSTATFKVIVNEVPILQQYLFPYDQWEGYAAERAKLLTFLKQHVKNVVFVSTDTHAVLTSDARLKTLEPGGPVNSGIFDFVTGPAATSTWHQELKLETGNGNAGNLVRQFGYKRKPPKGVGMQCANLNVYSYTEVKVTSKALTLTPKDLNGKQVQDKNASSKSGPPCGPFTVKKK